MSVARTEAADVPLPTPLLRTASPPPLRIAVVEIGAHGGLLHYAAQLADALAARGNVVDLILPRAHELSGRPGQARRREVLARRLPPSEIQPRGKRAYEVRRARVAVRLVASLIRILMTLGRGRYDAAVVQWDTHMPVTSFAARLLLRRPRRPRIAWVAHNVQPFNAHVGDELMLTSDQYRRRMAQVLGTADVVLVHGDRSADELRDSCPAVSPTIIPHGDEGLFGAGPASTAPEARILFFGEWRKVKGLPVLMQAFDLLSATDPSVRLTIAGCPMPADYDDRELRHWASERSDRVELLPRYIAMNEVPDLFARARVVAVPYLVGFQSGVVHLAMTMSRAVVATDVGDISAAVADQVTGVIVPPGDARRLAAALGRVASDPELARRMGEAGRERVSVTSSWARVAGVVETALREQMERP